MSLRIRGTYKEISLSNNVTSLSLHLKSINQTKNDFHKSAQTLITQKHNTNKE